MPSLNPDNYQAWFNAHMPAVEALDAATKAQLLADVTAAYQDDGVTVSVPIDADVALAYNPASTVNGGANDSPPGYWFRATDGSNVTSPWPDPWEDLHRYFQ